MTRRSGNAVTLRRRSGVALAAVLAVQALAAAPVAARPAGTDEPGLPIRGLGAATRVVPAPPDPLSAAPAAEAGLLPTIHYEDAIAHERDRIAFEPGGRVAVGFTPRGGDGWAVGGGRPRALPPGQASGAEMARAPQGSRWAREGAGSGSEQPAETDPPAEPPVDAPALDPADVEPAAGAAARAPAADVAADPAASGLFRQVFGFLPYWELSDSSTVLDYSVLSTIAYFSVGTDKDGNLLKKNADGTTTTGWGGWTSSKLTSVITAAHGKGTRVVLTITSFAWTSSQKTVQGTLLGNPTARLNLARQAAAAVRDRGADGINLDFEPIAAGYDDEFTALVRTFRAELDRIAPGYQLTFDTTGYIGNYPIEAATAPGGADAIFIMGYDYKSSTSSPVGSIAPLIGPTYDITDTLAAYLARVPASKLILGVPYYGRAWSTDTDQPHAKNISGTQYGTSTTVVYKTAADYALQHGRRWDSQEQSPYVVYRRENCTTTYGCVTAWRQIWFDDAASLKQKYDLVNRHGLRGAGIWALGYDDGRSELNQALADKFLNDTTAPVTGIATLPWRQRDAGFAVAWAGSDASGVAAWDVQVSVDGGPWTAWLTGTTRTSEIYLGEDGRGYAFRVRGRDRKGNLGAWDVTSTWRASNPLAVGGFGSVRVDSLAMRAGPSTTSAKLGELELGNLVAVVGGPTAAGGYTWWQVIGPLREWGPVTPATTSWVAQGSSSETYLTGSRAPNSTIVDAVLGDYAVGGARSTAASGSPRAFSPNDDGRSDTIPLTWTNATALDSLTLRVHRADGSLVGAAALGTLAAGAQRHDWDGRVGGSRVADGEYMLSLTGTAAGATYSAPSSQPVTPTQLAVYGVTVDTAAPPIAGAAISTAAFSPNGDAVRDSVEVTIQASGVATWEATVVPLAGPGAGSSIRHASGVGPTVTWSWDGRTGAGSAAPDGAYRITLWVADAAGNRAARSWDVSLDTRRPVVGQKGTPGAFSPNGDRVADTIAIGWSADEPASGTARILKGTTVVRSWAAGSAGTLTWDGRDAKGTAVADGRYVLRVELTDGAGNRATRDGAVVVDRTAAALAWSPALFFPQDGDRLAPTSTASFKLIRSAVTSLRVYDQAGAYVKTGWSNRTLAAGTHRWTWNGRAGSGAIVPRGWFKVVLTATSWVGTTTMTRFVLVDAYSVVASPSAPSGGQSLTLTIRSAEPLAAAPRVTFTQAGGSPVTKTATSSGGGRYVVRFTVAAGLPGPASVSITARDRYGRTNAMRTTITVH